MFYKHHSSFNLVSKHINASMLESLCSIVHLRVFMCLQAETRNSFSHRRPL